MNINDSTDVRKSYTYFKEMTSTLIDSHYALRINSSYVKDSAVYISLHARHQKSLIIMVVLILTFYSIFSKISG
ncbi:hypothetical protein CS542_05150 [Pedobacter sp. IW39]|nr:hypothetical protein CS542_05150 [Pedobacter sp. IW39]